MSKDIHLLHCRSSSKLKKLCNCLLSKYGSRNLTEKELNHDACQLQLECYYYFVHFYLKCLLLFWMFFKKLSVLCLWSSSFFYCKWWVPEQTQTQTQTLVLLGLMLVSLCALLPLFSLHWLWHHATLRSNWAIKPLTSMLCQESGLTQRFSLFGRSSSEPEELPSCHSDTAVSDKDSSDDINATDIHARYLSLSD